MSAIYGMINLDKAPVDERIFDRMATEYSGFKIDRFSSVIRDNAAFGAGIIYITKQSKNEVLPYYDEKNRILFTADAYLDNRDELIQELKNEGSMIDQPVDENTPDGMLIYISYLKWGQSFCDHLLGVFAIAIYDYNDGRFHLFVDHCGDRCVHYCIRDNVLYFSTLIRPIQAACDFKIRVSEKYIAACESNLSADMVMYPGMTPYEDIYQLLASRHLTAAYTDSKVSSSISQYWDPVNSVRPLKLKTDDEYRKRFVETYSKCVTDALNVDGNVGCFLSSGLDSTSVASLAAIHLKEQGKLLHSYTSVPIKEFLEGNSQRLEDESVPVQKFCDHFGNIVPTYVSCQGMSALTELERLVHLFNSPIKYSINAVWLYEIYKKAAEDGCKVILKGQHGNSSVSYGGLITRMWQEFTGLHFITAISQFKEFSRNMYVNKRGFLDAVTSEVLYELHPKTNLDSALTRKDLLEKYKLKKEYIKRERVYGGENIHSESQHKKSVFMPSSFQQVSYSNAHFELVNGIIARDPTRDKRIIELCLSMPLKCFSDGQYERRLITYYMKDIVPEHIIHQMYNRGLQSADYMMRIEKYSPDKSEYIKRLSDKKLLDYIDADKLKNLSFDHSDNSNVLYSINALSLQYFLNQ